MTKHICSVSVQNYKNKKILKGEAYILSRQSVLYQVPYLNAQSLWLAQSKIEIFVRNEILLPEFSGSFKGNIETVHEKQAKLLGLPTILRAYFERESDLR